MSFASDPLGYLADLAASSRPVQERELDGQRIFFLNDPVLVRRALLHHQRHLARSGGPQRLRRLLGEGLLRTQGERHHRARRLAQPAFSARRLGAYADTAGRIAWDHLNRCPRGTPFDLHSRLVRLTLAVAAESFFSLPLGREVRGLGAALNAAVRLLPDRSGLWEWWREIRFEGACLYADAFVESLVRSRRRFSLEQEDLLGSLIPNFSDDRQLRDELMTLLVAGFETTASALAWGAYLVASHPEVEARLAAEARGAALRGPLGAAHLEKLPYARAAFAETLRLYPPAWVLFRRVKRRFAIDGVEFPEGAHLMVSPYTLGRDERWFPRAAEFRPERWLDGGEEPPAYLPFGLGNRRCLGEAFAWNEGTLVLATMARDHRWQVAAGRTVAPEAGFTLRPRGLPVIRHPRWEDLPGTRPSERRSLRIWGRVPVPRLLRLPAGSSESPS